MCGGALVVLLLAMAAEILVGTSRIPASTVLAALRDFNPTDPQHLVVRHARVPRTLLGVVVGVALGLSGALMQSLTRNPLADPGILGINAGAAAAVVVAIAYFGIVSVETYVWFAFGGAAVVAVAVHVLGAVGGQRLNPARLVLAGAALSMTITAVTSMILAGNESVFHHFRFWTIGSLQGRSLDIVVHLAPFVVTGTVIALLLPGALNSLAMGDDTARGLGVNVGLVRLGALLAAVLLAGSATAAAGPIAFIGLAAPHIVRFLVGPDNRVVIPGVMVVAPATLLAADALGRVAAAPAELQTGIAAALVGAPVFLFLVRSKREMAL